MGTIWSRNHRGLLFSLVLAATLLRAFVPAGWMPAAGPSGVWVELCTSAVPTASGADAVANPGTVHYLPIGDTDHDQGDRDVCPFVGLAMAWTGAASPPVLSLPPPAAGMPFAVPSGAPQFAYFSQRPPSTGPPAHI